MPESTPTLPGGRAFTEVELVFLRALHRLEAKVDQMAARLETLVSDLTVEEDPLPELDLEGDPAGLVREQTQSLDPSDPK